MIRAAARRTEEGRVVALAEQPTELRLRLRVPLARQVRLGELVARVEARRERDRAPRRADGLVVPARLAQHLGAAEL